MFSNNKQISMRQTFRLFTYDLIGLSTLILPTFLARTAGCDGIFSILIGTAAALIYTTCLGKCVAHNNSDLMTRMQNHCPALLVKTILAWLLFHCVLVAGYTSYVFSNLMKRSLVRQESFWVILVVILGIAGYGIIGGIEGRARIYEVLFWVIMVPLFLMLGSAVKEIDVDLWTPVLDSSAGAIWKGSYLVFVFWEMVFWMVFFSRYVSGEKNGARLGRTVSKALVLAAAILGFLYLILLGTFGSGALAQMEYPAVTFMSTVQITGGFLKRADALMLGVWFFTLFALLNTNLFYGSTLVKELVGKKGNKRYMFLLLGLTFLVAAIYYLSPESVALFYRYIWYVGTPLLVILPGLLFLCTRGKGENKCDT